MHVWGLDGRAIGIAVSLSSYVDAFRFLKAAGIGDDLDEGCFALAEGVSEFVEALAELRYWPREAGVDLDAVAAKPRPK